MKQILYTLLASLLFVNVQAQTIKGKITAASGNPIRGATVSILNTEKTTITDRQGNFRFTNTADGTFQLSISATGFATQIKEIKVTSTQPAEITLILNEQARQLGEVVVTANKREEGIVKVSTSITSISAKKIEDTRTWGLSGLTALVPNYNYQELGLASQQIQSIRGIQVFSENPAVATYIDDVNNIDILANGFVFTDIERIEVLRGPQGTLFGRNAMGGVVNIITKKPANNTGGFVETGAGNLGLQRHGFGFKTPIIKDKLFLGINGLYQTQDGFLRNDTTGTADPKPDANGKLVGGESYLYGNFFLKWLPSKKISLTLNLKGQQDKSNGSGFMVSQFSDSMAFANPDKINLARIARHRRNILNTSLVAKYFGGKFTLTSISALQAIAFGFKDLDFPGIYHSFYDGNIGEMLPPQKVWTQEFRVTSNSDSKLQYTAGTYAFAQKGFEPTTNTAYQFSDAEAVLFGLPVGSFAVNRNRSNNNGVAVFGELGYQLTKKLKATAGLRYDYEKREAIFNGFGDAVLSNNIVSNIKPDTMVSGHYSALSPKVALSYALNVRSNIYFAYTRGFRAGGVNAQRVPAGVRQTFRPEYSDNYEAGYKTFLANNRLSIGASAFLIEWKDLQFFNLVAPFTYARENVGDARSAGLELEVSAIPVKGLQLDGSFGINQTRYKGFDLKRVNFGTGAETITAIGGNRLSNAPGHTVFFGTQYEHPISQKLKIVIRGEVRNIGGYYTDIQNNIQQPAYSLFNSRVGFSYDKYSLFFWGQNLNNERFLAYGNPDSSFGRSVRTAAPRTFGVTLNAKF
jgi:iron complex outermembrane recepter protein